MTEKPIKIAQKQATQIANTKRKPSQKGDLKIEDDHIKVCTEGGV